MFPEKGKRAKSYASLQKNLMSKLEELGSPDVRPGEIDELGFLMSEELYNNQQNNVSQLLQRARNITEKNQSKIVEARRSLLAKEKKNTFLTGVNLYQAPLKVEPDDDELNNHELGSVNLLHEVVSIKTDDLEQLTRMIRETGSRLNSYGRDLGKTKLRVVDAAGKVGRPMNSRIANNIEKYPELLPKLDEKPSSKRKFSTTTRTRFLKLM